MRIPRIDKNYGVDETIMGKQGVEHTFERAKGSRMQDIGHASAFNVYDFNSLVNVLVSSRTKMNKKNQQ